MLQQSAAPFGCTPFQALTVSPTGDVRKSLRVQGSRFMGVTGIKPSYECLSPHNSAENKLVVLLHVLPVVVKVDSTGLFVCPCVDVVNDRK